MQYTIFLKIALLGIGLAAFFIPLPLVAVLVTIFYITIISNSLSLWIQRTTGYYSTISFGFLLLLSFWVIAGSIIYYIYAFPALLALFVLLLPAIGIPHIFPKLPLFSIKNVISLFFFIGIGAWLLSILSSSATTEAIRSPWDVVPPLFFAGVFLSVLGGVTTLSKKKYHALSLPILLFVALPMLSVTILVYPLGFGFDPFIHEAAGTIIAEDGVLYPKTPYYIGQYVLVQIFHASTHLPLAVIDKLLVPFLTLLVLIPLAIRWLTHYAHTASQKTSMAPALGVLTLFVAPYFFLIFSTPQHLSYLFFLITLLTVLTARTPSKQQHLAWLPALATLFIHPLAGIPLCIWLFAMILQKYARRTSVGVVISASIILPLLFLLQGFINQDKSVILQYPAFSFPTFEKWLLAIRELHFFLPLDFATHYSSIATGLVFIFTFIGIAALLKKKVIEHSHFAHFVYLFFILLINFLILRFFLTFSYLINYEQLSFTNRLLDLLFISFLPFAMIGFYQAATRLRYMPKLVQIFSFIVIAAMLTASTYTTYPKNDAYAKGRNINTSAADFSAVAWINERAETDNYIVLANQAVSAAALRTYGFKRYSITPQGELFYYPIPTSSPLYQLYLDFVYTDHTRAPAQQAMKLMHTTEVFIVINDYWTDAKNIIKKATPHADEVMTLEDGRVTIFRYLQ